MATTPKWGLHYPQGTDTPDVPYWMNYLATDLDDVAKYSQGVLASRPAATTSGRYYFATDDTTGGTNGTLYQADGTNWNVVAVQNRTGTLATRPTASAANKGMIYHASDIGSFFISNGSAWQQTSVPHVRVFHSTTQNVSSGVVTALSFDSEAYDLGTPSSNMHDTATNNERITIRVAGLYLVQAFVRSSVNTTGYRFAIVTLNGTTQIGRVGGPAVNTGGATTQVCCVFPYRFAVNDYFTVSLSQDSGSTLTTIAGVDSTSMSATWLSP